MVPVRTSCVSIGAVGAGGGVGAGARWRVVAARLARRFGLVMSTETVGSGVADCSDGCACAVDWAGMPRQKRAAMLTVPILA